MRWGECAGLTWSEVDLDAATVRVVQVAEETPQGVTPPAVPEDQGRCAHRAAPQLPEGGVAEAPRRFPERSDLTDLVFPTRQGKPILRGNFRREVWNLALAGSGLPTALRFHDLRHSYATWLISDGVPVNAVQRVMGHANASTTLDRYTHTPTDYQELVQEVRDLCRLFQPLTARTRMTRAGRHSHDLPKRPIGGWSRKGSDPRRGRRGPSLDSAPGGSSRIDSVIAGGATTEGLGCRKSDYYNVNLSRNSDKHASRMPRTSSTDCGRPTVLLPV
jgi:hypothetical protein